jgi:ElaB/YqjD/DUF883 family membrane-anchored ribosome-binding protein
MQRLLPVRMPALALLCAAGLMLTGCANDQLRADIQRAQQTANQALQAAAGAQQSADRANQKADQALTAANQATQTANQANQTANEAMVRQERIFKKSMSK